MKKLLICLSITIQFAQTSAQPNIDSLLLILDNAVANHNQYSNIKDENLNITKLSLTNQITNFQRFIICSQLYDDYKYYQYDSAMFYANRAYYYANLIGNDSCISIALIKQAEIIGLNGMFNEALTYINKVNINRYPNLKTLYYQVYRLLYSFNGNYLLSGPERTLFIKQADAYTDSTLLTNFKHTNQYVLILADKLIAEKKFDKALTLLKDAFKQTNTDIHTLAVIAHYISGIYAQLNNPEMEKYWLTHSAINDMLSATKEYISLRRLAFMLYQDGDTDRSYKYIKRTLEDAIFCNARQRIFNISEILQLIDKAYQDNINARQRQMLVSLISISLLSIFLLLAILFVYMQMRKLSVARTKLSQANLQLVNINKKMLESNIIKEEYIGRYMDQCSEYIDKLDNYRRLLNKTAATGNLPDVLKILKSKKIIDNELEEFYNNFDTTFLQLFPNFINEFLKLLNNDEYPQLKPGQLLNTELRIYALMRLGINDGVKIAHFLRCSTSTIYNYRTKYRNKANVQRDEFEKCIMQIGLYPN